MHAETIPKHQPQNEFPEAEACDLYTFARPRAQKRGVEQGKTLAHIEIPCDPDINCWELYAMFGGPIPEAWYWECNFCLTTRRLQSKKRAGIKYVY